MPRRRKEPPPSDVDQIVDEPGVDADGEDVDMAVDSPPEDDDVTEDKDEEDVRVFHMPVT